MEQTGLLSVIIRPFRPCQKAPEKDINILSEGTYIWDASIN